MSNRRQVLASIGLVSAAVVTVAAFSLRGGSAEPQQAEGHDHAAMVAAAERTTVKLDPESARRIGVTYATVMLQPLSRQLELVGNVTYDETRLHNVNARIEGWVERLYIDFTGAPIAAGQPLMTVYSPMLVAAQEELLLAKRLVESAAGTSERATRNAQDLLDASRRRLRYWDIPQSEITRIERSGAVQRTLTLRAPTSGIVVEKLVVEGMRIMPGMDVYRIADLSRVWVEGEVYEKDLAQVGVGMNAGVTFEAYPGEQFRGRVTYVYPTLSPESRTGRVRVELTNPQGRLKPGMYARLTLEATSSDPVLAVPRTAVHFTGPRALVFVRHDDGTLMQHDVVTGGVSGDFVQILSGVSEGQQVVRSASFLVDAESSLGTLPGEGSTTSPASMAPPEGGQGGAGAGGAAPANGTGAGADDPHAAHRAPAADPHAAHRAPAPAPQPAPRAPAADPHAAHRK